MNSVWCIKILSPQEAQQMGKHGLELLNSVHIQRLSNGSYDDYTSRQDSKNLSFGILCAIMCIDREEKTTMKCYPWIDMHCDSLLRAYRDGSGSLWDEEGRLYFQEPD